MKVTRKSKLTVEQVKEIKAAKDNPYATAHMFARKFDVSERTISNIWNGKTWASE